MSRNSLRVFGIYNAVAYSAFLFLFVQISFSQGLPLAKPEAVGMSSAKLDQIDALIEKDIADKKLPGAVVLVGHKGKIVFRRAYGNRSLVPKVEKMTVDTIFDVASLTKPVATATSIMILVEQGKLRLSDTVGKFIPEIQDEAAKKITIQQLLIHTSGYAPDFDLKEKWIGRDGMMQALAKEKLRTPPGTKFVYSDIGFIALGEIVERASGKTLDVFAKANQLAFLNTSTFLRRDMNRGTPNTLYKNLNLLERIAPTENVCGQQSYLGGTPESDCGKILQILRGEVHDPTSFRMNGVAGHAGLFSTADDLARYCQMLLNGGILAGKRVLAATTVAKMTSPIVVSDTGETRGLGWDINTSFSANRGELFPLGSFGHTGFTGTGIWIDPTSQTFVVFLSNRVHPDGKGDVGPLRAKVSTVVASAIEDTPIEKFREAEARYNAAVAAQVQGFKFKVQSQSPTSVSSPTVREGAIVLNGIDVLQKNNFKPLEGLRVGLVTNHTGRNRAGKPTIDLLYEAKNLKLVALFSPEHGIRGAADEKVSDSVDEKTGLPIYSLYGETRKPKPEQLENLDAIVFDIQDIGTRFYTYISTLKGVLEEAAKAKKKVFVFDRVNPINGVDVEGPVADADKLSFIAPHRIPVRHGMTIGELARMFNDEDKIGADLEIIKTQNWTRAMWFDETNQTWINPSPNMRSLTEATLYPGIGLLETTNLSVGRGTDTPFEIIGAPWLDGQKLAAHLNQQNLAGVRFIPVKFKPNASVFKDEECSGVNILITNRATFKPVRTGFEVALALRKLFPNEWKYEKYDRLLVNAKLFQLIANSAPVAEIGEAIAGPLADFEKRRAQFLLY